MEKGRQTLVLRKKLRDNNVVMALALLSGGIVGSSLWIWDYVIDPKGAENTVFLRLMFLAVIFGALVFYKVTDIRVINYTYIVVFLYAEILYTIILFRLQSGMLYGISGYMMVMIVLLAAGLGLSTWMNILMSLLMACLPHLLAIGLQVSAFDHLRYGVMLWPTAGLMIFLQIALGLSYQKRYDADIALLQLSNRDSLTNISNRRCFMDRFEQELDQCRRYGCSLAVLMFDMDYFKNINDNYGHLIGDKVIVKTAETIRDSIRSEDLLARFGGEEFIVMLKGNEAVRAIEVAERIRVKISEQVFESDEKETFGITISVGVYVVSQFAGNSWDIIRQADEALYMAKAKGRNRVEKSIMIE